MLVRKLAEAEDRQGKAFDLIVLAGYMKLVTQPLLDAYRDKIINVHPADLSVLNVVMSGNASTADVEVMKFLASQSHSGLAYEFDPLGSGSEVVNVSRKYVGDNAVLDAINDGVYETRSTVILVDEGEDHGESLVTGPRVAVDRRHYDNDRAMMGSEDYKISMAELHQERQKYASDHPALTHALRLIANGIISIGESKQHFNEWRGIYLRNTNVTEADKKNILLPYQGIDMPGIVSVKEERY